MRRIQPGLRSWRSRLISSHSGSRRKRGGAIESVETRSPDFVCPCLLRGTLKVIACAGRWVHRSAFPDSVRQITPFSHECSRPGQRCGRGNHAGVCSALPFQASAADAGSSPVGVTTEHHRAIKSGDAAKWRELQVASTDVQARDEKGNTAWHFATHGAKSTVVSSAGVS